MPADQVGARRAEDSGGGRGDLAQGLGLHPRRHARQDHRRERDLRCSAHRPDVAQRVDRGETGQLPGILGEAAQVVGRDHLDARAVGQDGGIVARAAEHVGALGRGQHRQGRLEIVGPDLGPAPAAERLVAQFGADARGKVPRQGRRLHLRQIVELLHEGAVDPVLPAPEPVPGGAQTRLVGERALAAERDQLEVVLLRPVGAALRAGQVGAEIVKQDRRLAHREDPGLGAGGKAEVGAVTGGVDRRVRGPQERIDGHEALVQVEPGRGQPALRQRPRRADDQVGGRARAVGQQRGPGLDPGHLGLFAQGHARLPQRVLQRHAGPRRQARQRGGAVEQRDLGPRPQPVRAGHRQFRPRDPGPQHEDTRPGLARLDGGDETGPAVGEGVQRLGGNGVRGEARKLRHLGGDADVERGDVVGNRRATGEMDAPGVAVDAHCPVQDQARARGPGETDEVHLERLPRVMPGDEARQHPGISRGRAGIDQRQPHAGQRFHGPAAQDQGMGMPAADENQVAGERQGAVHRGGLR